MTENATPAPAAPFARATPAIPPVPGTPTDNNGRWVRHAAGVVLMTALAALLVVEPGWPIRAAALPVWLSGWWHVWLVPAAALGVLVALMANTAAPGGLWGALQRVRVRAVRALPLALAATLAYAALLLVAGVLTPAQLAHEAAVRGLFALLFPGTPFVLACAALAAGVVFLDARQQRIVDWVARGCRGFGPGATRLLTAAAPVVAAAVAAGVVATVVFPGAMRGWARADPPGAQRHSYYTSFVYGALPADTRIEQLSGFQPGYDGLTLEPGREGTLVVRLERDPDTAVVLRSNFYDRIVAGAPATGAAVQSVRFENRLEIAAGEGQPFRTLLTNQTVGEAVGTPPFDLTPLLAGERVYRLRFSARNITGSAVTALTSFSVSAGLDREALPDATFPIVFYAAAAASALTLLASLFGAARSSRPAERTVGALVALASGTAAPGRRAARVALVIACLLVAAVALDARWQQLMAVHQDLLAPDAAGYQAIAAELPEKTARYRLERPSEVLDTLYASGFDGRVSAAATFYASENNGREPGWPLALRLVYNVLGVSAFHTRLTSLGFAVVLAALTCWLGWRVLHPLAGLIGGLLYALHPAQVTNSVAGLREELVSLLFVALVAGVFVGVRRGAVVRPWRLALVGVCGGALVLVRADMVVLAGLIVTLGAIALRWDWREWLAATGVVAALAGPMYGGYALTRLDPFFPGTYGATVNRNLEFQHRLGTPGFPTPEQYAVNWAAPPYTSPMTYFFGYHTPAEFIQFSARGFLRIFNEFLYRGQPVRLAAFLAGAALLLVRRRWLAPSLVVVGLVPFYSFLAGAPGPMFVPRYAHHVLPYTELIAGYGLGALPLLVLHRVAAARPRLAAALPLRFLSRLGGPRRSIPIGVIFAGALAVALAIEPAGATRLAAPPLWLAGFWRAWLVSLTAGVLLLALAANAVSPGAANRAYRSLLRGVGPSLPALLAVGLGYASLAMVAGVVTPAAASRAAALFGMQLVLFPGTPMALACIAIGALVLRIDGRGQSLPQQLARWWRGAAPLLARWLPSGASLAGTALAAAAVAAAVFPDAMRGWGTAAAPDAQAHDLYRSFFNYSLTEDARQEQRSGFGLGLRGLTLAPGASGSIVTRLDRPPRSVVLLKAEFYNRRLAESGETLSDESFPNALEVAAGEGAPFVPVLRDASLGEIAGGQMLDLTPLLGTETVYRLRFSASNTTTGEVTVLPSFLVSVVTDEGTVPHATFPIVAYAAVAAAIVHALARGAGRASFAGPSGLVAGVLVAGVARLAALAAPAAPTARMGAVLDTSLLLDLHNSPDADYALRAARLAAGLIITVAASVAAWAALRRGDAGSVSASRGEGAAGGMGQARRYGRAWLLVACLVVAAVATDARWQQLMQVRYQFLVPDARDYQAIAAGVPEKMSRYRLARPSPLLEAAYESGFDGHVSAAAAFYAADHMGREPGWPFALRLVYNVLGVSAFHTRLASLGLSVALAALTCWLGWRVLHPLAGLAGGLL